MLLVHDGYHNLHKSLIPLLKPVSDNHLRINSLEVMKHNKVPMLRVMSNLNSSLIL